MSSGYVLIMCKLPCKMNDINDDLILLSFGMFVPGQSSYHLYMANQLVHVVQSQASCHIKVKKGIGHVFFMATPSHAIESVYAE